VKDKDMVDRMFETTQALRSHRLLHGLDARFQSVPELLVVRNHTADVEQVPESRNCVGVLFLFGGGRMRLSASFLPFFAIDCRAHPCVSSSRPARLAVRRATLWRLGRQENATVRDTGVVLATEAGLRGID